MPGFPPQQGFSWYDVLGVLPGASAAKIRRSYDAKVGLLRPELISGAPSNVVRAVSRAHSLLDGAWRALGDPVNRERYDEASGFRRSGTGLRSPGTSPPIPGGDRATSVTLAAAMPWTSWAA